MPFSETVTLLRAQQGRACKTITPKDSKAARVPKYWFYEPSQIKGLDDFAALLSKIESNDKVAIIRGQPKQTVQPGSVVLRREVIFESRPLRLTCFDIDKLQAPEGVSPISNDAIEFAIRQFPPAFRNVSYVAQFSANAGRRGQIIKLHLWFMLHNPQTDRAIRAWAKSMGGLIDEALFNSIQIHYTANPHFEGGEPDPFNGVSRVRYVRKANEFADFEPPLIADIKGPSERADVEIVTDDEGKAIDGREALLLKIRWKILQNRNRPRTREAFYNRVWEEFGERAVLGPTTASPNSYNYERVAQSCATDWEKHGEVILPPKKKTVPLDEAMELIRRSVKDAFAGGQVAIKVPPGVGKSRTAAEEVMRLPNIEQPHIEIYAITREQQREWETLLKKAANKVGKNIPISRIEGRNKDTCQKIETANALQKMSISVGATLCNGKLGGEGKCEYFDTCPYQAQFHETGPGIRIYSHAHLATPRHGKLSQPDVVVIDESFLGVAVEDEKFSRNDLNRVIAGIRGNRKNDFEVRNATIKTIDAVFVALATNDRLLLHRLREGGIDVESLRDAAKEISKVTPYIAPRKGEVIASLKARATQQGRASYVLAVRLFRALARELETGRTDTHCIMWTDDSFRLCRRKPLPRLEGVKSVLLLDADLERENVTPFFPDIRVDEIDCDQNLRIEQISDLSFSRTWLGLGDEAPNEERISELCALIYPLLGAKPLIVTYKKFIPHLRERLPARCQFTYFGNLRGTNAFKKCEAVFVIGRQFLSTATIEAQARALHYDSPEPLNFETVTRWHAVAPDAVLPATDFIDPRLQALMSSQREGETRQAVGRVRAVRSPEMKKAYLFSNQPIPGLAPDHLIEFKLSEASRIYSDLGGYLPLNSKLLVKLAGGSFPRGGKQASKWCGRVSSPQCTNRYYIVDWGLEGGPPTQTRGRIRGTRGGRKFPIWVDYLWYPRPELCLPAIIAAKTGIDVEVDPLPWVKVPSCDLPAGWRIPGLAVKCLEENLSDRIAKWKKQAQRANEAMILGHQWQAPAGHVCAAIPKISPPNIQHSLSVCAYAA